ncbi:histidinol-phosphatase HisJ [Romboutsia sp.]|uniref:histidinol-phosphatase HisJ n=1 Tax=Romboutsia sp. TaxID=1965302 RepID=UPI003F362CD7
MEVGIEEITFTEHLPLPNNFKDPSSNNDSAMNEDEALNYFKELSILKEKYKEKIKINSGVEVDYLEGYEHEIKNMLDKYGKYIEDSIISVHIIKIGEEYHFVDSNPKEFEKIINILGSIEEVYNKYYETIKLVINSDLGEYKPKRIGHLNLVRKFNQVFPYDYSKNKKLEEVVTLIKEKGYELDYNVSGLRKEYCKEPYLYGYLLELIKKYKIPTVLGSDSHSSNDIGSTLENTSNI